MIPQFTHYSDINKEILDTVKIGDSIKINNWDEPMIVKAVSENYFVMIGDNGEYSVCEKKIRDKGNHNKMVKGKFHCGGDDWIFNSPLCISYNNVYKFENAEVNDHYLKDFEDGKAHLSERNGIAINDLYIAKGN